MDTQSMQKHRHPLKTKPIHKPKARSPKNPRLQPQPRPTSPHSQQDTTDKLKCYLQKIPHQQPLPYSHLVNSDNIDRMEVLMHIVVSFTGISRILRCTDSGSMPDQYLFDLPTQINDTQKTLFLDLDQTLIHTLPVPTANCEMLEVEVNGLRRQIYFQVRPHCQHFLKTLSEVYEIYIFTASEAIYAEAITKFLNRKLRTITGFVSRERCLRTPMGYFLKDLRMVRNRSLSQLILVDNLSLCFGGTIDNGVPILAFTGNGDDCELKCLCEWLRVISCERDVRESIRSKWRLRSIVVLEPLLKEILCCS